MTIQPAADSFEMDSDSVADDAGLRRKTRLAMSLVGLLIFGFLGLAALLQVGGAVTASGEVAVESSVRIVTHPTGGVLTALAVHDGDHVAEGQELMRFDTSVSGIGSSSASSGLTQLITRQSRLEAERDGADAVTFVPAIARSIDPEIVEVRQRAIQLFKLRRQDRIGALTQLSARIRQYQDQIRGIEAQIEAIDAQAKLIEPELAGLRALYQKQLVSIARINQLERTAVSFQGSRAAYLASIAEVRARISETREQMLNVDKTRRSDAATELATVVTQLGEQQVRSASANDTFARSVIRAPQSGTVDKLAYATIGSAVPPGQPILQIVPDRDSLIVEAHVRPADVDQLRIGQPARVTFSGLDRQTTPDMPGKLIFIAPDRTQDQRTGQAYFRIKVRLYAGSMARAEQIQLQAGMPAEVFVQTGDRSILSFLTKPLLDQLRHALRED